MKRTTRELYGTNPDAFCDLPYREALEVKLQLARNRLGEVTKKLMMIDPGSPYEAYSRLVHLQKDVIDAIKFNEDLIDELDR